LQQAFEQIPKQKAEQREHAQSIAEIHQPAKGEIYISGHSQQDDGKQKKGKRKFRSGFLFQNRLADYDTRREAQQQGQAGSLGADPADRQVQAAAAANVETITTLVRLSELKIYPKKPE